MTQHSTTTMGRGRVGRGEAPEGTGIGDPPNNDVRTSTGGIRLDKQETAGSPITSPITEGNEALDELRGGQPALPLLDRDVGVDRLRHAELAEELDHERHAGPAGDQRGIDRRVDLEGQPRGCVGHRVPPCEWCTHWVNGSKHDAIFAGRMGGGPTRNPFSRSWR